MLRFRSLGSGSSGNATVIEAGGLRPVRVLVDCGLSLRTLTHRLAQAGLGLEDIDALFITHEHGDHVGCGPQLAARHGIAIWMSEGTWRSCGEPALGPLLQWAAHDQPIDLGGLELRPLAVPHDAREPLQLRCTDGDAHLGVLTDLGHAPACVLDRLQGCQALLLECNHDEELLHQSPYPQFLKRRVAGDRGHLSNRQAADIARALHPRLRHVLAGHLSRQNNRADLVREALGQALGTQVHIDVADAVAGSDWIRV